MRQIAIGFLCLVAAACGQQSSQSQPKGLSAADAAFQKQLQEQFLDAKPGTVIEIPAGKHALDRVLTLRANGVTIRGAGTDSSILSFKNEISGPEGILVYGSDFTIENLSIEDTKGDGLKINDGENITIRGVRVAWTGGPQTSNGAYGIYPVSSRNVLIENSSSWGASDAGIYVGQSIGVIVRNCHAEQNVAGIEIENTISADVYDNVATGNTGGILVFNMPNLQTARTLHASVQEQGVQEQSRQLCGQGCGGGERAGRDPGWSSIPTARSKFSTTTSPTTRPPISSSRPTISTNYYNKPGVDPNYDPYPRSIYVYDNRFAGGGDAPDGLDLKTLKVAMFGLNGHFPDVLWDGYQDEKNLVNGAPPAAERICVRNGSATVLNADGPTSTRIPPPTWRRFSANSRSCRR